MSHLLLAPPIANDGGSIVRRSPQRPRVHADRSTKNRKPKPRDRRALARRSEGASPRERVTLGV
jgi:hypothetical protein